VTRYDVCAAVVSHLPYDARAWKEARSLVAAGKRVKLVGCRYDIDAPQRRQQDGIDIVEMPFGAREGGSNVDRAAGAFRVWQEILRTPASAYHSHNIHVGPPSWLASRLRRSALIYDAHELYGESQGSGIAASALQRVSSGLERFMVKRSDGVITTNRSRADVLEQRHGRQDVEVLANVPPIAEHLEPLDPGYPEGAQVLLYQGGIYAEFRAFRETMWALRSLEGVHLVVLGFGRREDLDLIELWAEEAGVADRVRLLGPRPFDELVHTAAAATIGLVPIKPLNWGSFLGDTNKLYEYLMAGLPVAASDLPEIARVATDGSPQVGEVFDATSSDSIADAVRRLLDDPEVYAARRQEARRLALERYNWDVEKEKLLGLYARCSPNGSRS
jgi:glycosyltransferase involved in cell wall biosynthesis